MTAKTVDDYILNQSNWNEELIVLRNIMLENGLEEHIKWGAPTYSYRGQNVVGIASFKQYFGLWFFQGALINDSKQVLMNAQEEKTKAMRQWRMNNANEIDGKSIGNYISQAKKMVDDGVKIKPEKKPLEVPIMLKKMLENLPELAKNFDGMGLSKQREFCDYINEAKQQATKERRLDKVLQHIEQNKGLNDKYR